MSAGAFTVGEVAGQLAADAARVRRLWMATPVNTPQCRALGALFDRLIEARVAAHHVLDGYREVDA